MSTTPLGDLLRIHCERRGINQNVFATLSGYSEAYLSSIKTGTSRPTNEELLNKLAVALQLTEAERLELVLAAHYSQKSLTLSNTLRPEAYVVAHRFFNILEQLSEDDLKKFEKLITRKEQELQGLL